MLTPRYYKVSIEIHYESFFLLGTTISTWVKNLVIPILFLGLSFTGCQESSELNGNVGATLNAPSPLSTKTKAKNNITVDKKQTTLIPKEGLVYYNNKPFTGTALSEYEKNVPAETIDYLEGKKEGYFRKWFPNKVLSFEAAYMNGQLHGTSKTWFKNGNLRSESNYVAGIAQGLQKQWYKSGAKFKELNLVDGREEGMQRAWRENGKIYNNYEAKNGRIFGLKRSSLCYELEDEVVQYKDK